MATSLECMLGDDIDLLGLADELSGSPRLTKPPSRYNVLRPQAARTTTRFKGSKLNQRKKQRKISKLTRELVVAASLDGVDELGFNFLKAIGKTITAPVRIVGKVATGDFKGALRTAVDPAGFSDKNKRAKKVVGAIAGAASKVIKPPSVSARVSMGAQGRGGAVARPAQRPAPRAPEVQIRAQPCDHSAADRVASQVAAKVGPEVTRINKILTSMELTSKATSEHNAIKRRNAWRKQVLRELQKLQAKMGARCA